MYRKLLNVGDGPPSFAHIILKSFDMRKKILHHCSVLLIDKLSYTTTKCCSFDLLGQNGISHGHNRNRRKP